MRTLHSQRGVVLFISLVILVLMSVAGIALMRLIDAGNDVASNFAFRQSAMAATDRGVEVAVRWLEARSAAGTLGNADAANGYATVIPAGGEPDWQDSDSWSDAVSRVVATPEGKAVDPFGNEVRYRIVRLCNAAPAGVALPAADFCAISLSSRDREDSASNEGENAGVGSEKGSRVVVSLVYYKVVVRTTGPRNTSAVVETLVSLPFQMI